MNLQISTSYISKISQIRKKFPNAKIVAVCSLLPDYLDTTDIFHLTELAPQSSILWEYKKGNISKQEYTKLYTEQLNKIDKQNILKKIYNECNDHKQAVLICYENPSKFCHRHILSEWLVGIRTELSL